MKQSRKIDRIVVTEKQFSQQIEQLLDLFGWRWCHFRPARTAQGWRTAISGYEGFPDYIAVKGKRLLIAEIKSDKGKLSPEQEVWLDELAACGQEVYLWRPAHFEEIARILRSRLPCESKTSWSCIKLVQQFLHDRKQKLQAGGQLVSGH